MMDPQYREYRISTHAPAQGATARVLGAVTALLFQPTLPHRERLGLPEPESVTVNISTHAPAQGATAKGYKKHPFILCKTEKNLLNNFFKDILIQKIV